MVDFSTVKAGNTLKYVGDNWMAFSGTYTVYPIEETYKEGMCPEEEKGKLVIIEFMNNGTPMFFTFNYLKATEWEVVA